MMYQQKMAVFVKLTHFQHLPSEKRTLEMRGVNGGPQQCSNGHEGGLIAHVPLQPLENYTLYKLFKLRLDTSFMLYTLLGVFIHGLS